jgi:hypothetical protein
MGHFPAVQMICFIPDDNVSQNIPDKQKVALLLNTIVAAKSSLTASNI